MSTTSKSAGAQRKCAWMSTPMCAAEEQGHNQNSTRSSGAQLIDLGAAADLRTGTNYQPDESILDPTYAAPEQAWPGWPSVCSSH